MDSQGPNEPAQRRFGRRPILKGGLVAAAAAVAAPSAVFGETARAAPAGRAAPVRGDRALPVPPVIRSRDDLIAKGARVPLLQAGASALPITLDGVTYEMAQDMAWLDAEHFAVGRWDGSMSIFEYGAAPFGGPLIREAVNSPSFAGVQMVAALPGNAIATTNDDASIALWRSPSGTWKDLALVGTLPFDAALGVATSGRGLVVGDRSFLVVGHTSGFASLWRYHPATRNLVFRRAVDLRNPVPVNPWGLHDIRGVDVVVGTDGVPRAVTGSEDGYVSILDVPSGAILSQTVFNPSAQRGINSVSVAGESLLVANCSVGSADHNLWYFSIDRQTWAVTLRDQANLLIDTQRPQAFNFETVWGSYGGNQCWFASTEEGALWMGTAGPGLSTLGYQEVTSPLGSTLAYKDGPGRLAMVAYDLYQYSTAAP
ncbi:hypothetical protein [Saccharothrix xinjiangensis]|uniref:WD40 repeat domain-containing protein n=1 Tax=Saccharothrix xinjiangensis TaxID=204798 RepID=A0ABV9YF48_9PSEU